MQRKSSHMPVAPQAVKQRRSFKKRVLNALAIASKENPDILKIRQHRLGEAEGGQRPRKRVRMSDNENANDDVSSQRKLRDDIAAEDRFDELDIDAGSDSEGNKWRLGHVDLEDDSDIDSDEAFGDSDEERFEGFTFRGSTRGDGWKKDQATNNSTLDLEEDTEDLSESHMDECDLGEGVMDLADVLDATKGSEKLKFRRGTRRGTTHDGLDVDDEEYEEDLGGQEGDNVEKDGDDDDDHSSDDESSITSVEDNEEANPEKLDALNDLIASLQSETTGRAKNSEHFQHGNEHDKPFEFGLTSTRKLTIADLASSVSDPALRKSLKLLDSDSSKSKTRSGIQGKLEVPLSKRQQDRIDRTAAYEKSKETLDRWVDTVKHNRRAEHLSFPLVDPGLAAARTNKQLQPISKGRPITDLERTIQTILQESGLNTTNEQTDEDKIRASEEIETNKLPIEEVQARRAQLRMARELLFREEVRAKRIKKIKSKSYRRVHRKEKEKNEQMLREARGANGEELSENEAERADRRRAEERMGAKHRDSKWAKSVKKIGRATWDDDARGGITEMARKNEELRRRVEGKAVRGDFDGSEASDTESSESTGDEDEPIEGKLLRKLSNVDQSTPEVGTITRLNSMKFMQTAAAARKKENDAAVELLRRDLAGEEAYSDDGVEEVGRKKYGPGSGPAATSGIQNTRTRDFEEPLTSDDEERGEPEEDNIEVITNSKHPKRLSNQRTKPSHATHNTMRDRINSHEPSDSKGLFKLADSASKHSKPRKNRTNTTADSDFLLSAPAIVDPVDAKKHQNPRAKSNTSTAHSDAVILHDFLSSSDDEDGPTSFAGADALSAFRAEKSQVVKDEDDKVIDATLPGWGSWAGEGISKNRNHSKKSRLVTVEKGIRPDVRQDAKLDRVIINEKRVKKNSKYFASTLPHPFETRAQYERALRLPIGPEWTTKDTFQQATKPRVLVKQGVIAPMERPII